MLMGEGVVALGAWSQVFEACVRFKLAGARWSGRIAPGSVHSAAFPGDAKRGRSPAHR